MYKIGEFFRYNRDHFYENRILDNISSAPKSSILFLISYFLTDMVIA